MKKYLRVTDVDLKLINRLMGKVVADVSEMNEYNRTKIYPGSIYHLYAQDIDQVFNLADKAHGECFICKSNAEFKIKFDNFKKTCKNIETLKEKLLLPIPLPRKEKTTVPVRFDFFKYRKETKRIEAAVFILAILLTPLSLLITLPMYFNWQKKNYLPDSAPAKTHHLKV